MGKESKSILILLACLLLARISDAQVSDTLWPQRDKIGDLNEAVYGAGEFPGALRIPGTSVSLAIGGFIKAVGFYDTKYNVKNEVILPGTFSASNIYKGQTYIGARSSRLFFDGRTTLGRLKAGGYFEMDFRGNSGFTLRHAYLNLKTQAGIELLMGQYWSLLMDLKTIPEGLVEPTLSGAGFARHGQIRITVPVSDKINLLASLEEPDNSDLKGEDINPLNTYPVIVAALSIDPSAQVHFSFMGSYRPVAYAVLPDESVASSAGFLTSISAVFKFMESDKLAVSGMYGQGMANYIMGADGTAGYYGENGLALQTEYGAYASYHHIWNEKFRSNIAYGKFLADEIDATTVATIRSSSYGFVNMYYKVHKYVNIGIEWIYTTKENYGGEDFNNSRFQFGIQVF